MAEDNETLDAEEAPSGEVPHAVQNAPEKGEAVPDFFNLDEVYRRVLATADEELRLSNTLLFWSGLTGGLVLGLCILARAAFTALAPDGGNGLVANLLYPVGFIFLILGRYQLFTENTLTPVALVLTRLASVRDLLRIWGVVLAANIVGAALFAALLAFTGVLSPEGTRAAISFGEHLIEAGPWDAFYKAILAGWLLAGIVWLVHAARETLARVVLIWLLIYLQICADLFHCVVGSVEVLFLIFKGSAGLGDYLFRFLVPVVLGNTLGGVVFVAFLNYMQFGEDKGRFSERGDKLSWREWLTGTTRTQGE